MLQRSGMRHLMGVGWCLFGVMACASRTEHVGSRARDVGTGSGGVQATTGAGGAGASTLIALDAGTFAPSAAGGAGAGTGGRGPVTCADVLPYESQLTVVSRELVLRAVAGCISEPFENTVVVCRNDRVCGTLGEVSTERLWHVDNRGDAFVAVVSWRLVRSEIRDGDVYTMRVTDPAGRTTLVLREQAVYTRDTNGLDCAGIQVDLTSLPIQQAPDSGAPDGGVGCRGGEVRDGGADSG